MNNLFRLRDELTGRLYVFLSLDSANSFQDSFIRPYDLVEVDFR